MTNRGKKQRTKPRAALQPSAKSASAPASSTATPRQTPAAGQDAALQSVGEVHVRYEQNPTSPLEGKKIHSRRPLPPVREAPLPEEPQTRPIGDRK